MQSQYQKDKQFQKVQKKLQKPNLPLQQLLTQQCIIQMFRSSHKSLHNQYISSLLSLKIKDFKQMITYVTTVGPQQDKLRSYKYPLVSSEILSSQIPKILDIMFSSSEEDTKSPTLFSLLLKYFQGAPNDTLSGYVIKIVSPLYTYEPVKTQQAIVESKQLVNMTKFIYSRSVGDFLVKFVVVESESLLTLYFKERKELLVHLISIYQKSDSSDKEQVYLLELVYVLGEVVSKLWNDKHKELGKMAPTIIKLISTILLTQSSLFNQQYILYQIITNLVHFSDNSSHLIKTILNKSYRQITSSSLQTIKTSRQTQIPKLGIKRMYLLKIITLCVVNCPNVVREMGSMNMLMNKLFELLNKHEWNSLLHIEIETIFKQLFKENNQELLKMLLEKWSLTDVLKQMIRKEERKISQGYSGILTSICLTLSTSITNNTSAGKYLKSKEPLLLETCDQYVKPKQQKLQMNLGGYQSKNGEYSKPQYNQEELLVVHKEFFNQIHILEEIEKLPVSTSSIISEDIYDEIENENIVNSSWGLKSAEKT